jgi:glycosyltransferase involved in cell wall biosynthesis
VATRVGGIPQQIVDGVSGRLVGASDLAGFSDAVSGLLADPAEANRLGAEAGERARDNLLVDRKLAMWAELLAALI